MRTVKAQPLCALGKRDPSDGGEALREEIAPVVPSRVLSHRKLPSRCSVHESAAVSLRVKTRDDAHRHQ